MKKIITMIVSLAFLTTGSVYADKVAGEKIAKKKCSSCHNPTKDQLAAGMGPSWQMVSVAYTKDGKPDLFKFWKGEADAKLKVTDGQKTTMKGQLKVTKKFTDAEKEDVADYILSN